MPLFAAQLGEPSRAFHGLPAPLRMRLQDMLCYVSMPSSRMLMEGSVFEISAHSAEKGNKEGLRYVH